MRIATAPVNWNNADVADYRPWTPYPALLDEMVAAGYTATEWGMNMEKIAARLRVDLHARNLKPLGGFIGLELRNPNKHSAEVQRGIELATFFRDIGATYLIVAELIGTTTGITWFITQQARYQHFENVYAAIMMIGIIGVGTDLVLGYLGRRMFPWDRSLVKSE